MKGIRLVLGPHQLGSQTLRPLEDRADLRVSLELDRDVAYHAAEILNRYCTHGLGEFDGLRQEYSASPGSWRKP